MRRWFVRRRAGRHPRRMGRSALRVMSLSLVLAGGCGSSTGGPSSAAVLVVTPNQASVATAECPPSHCGSLTGQREVLTSITVRETGGVAGTIRRVVLSLRRQSDNAQIAGGEEGQGTRFAAGGSVSIPIALHYDQALGERNMKVVVSVEADDDNGHFVTASTVEFEVLTPAGFKSNAVR